MRVGTVLDKRETEKKINFKQQLSFGKIFEKKKQKLFK